MDYVTRQFINLAKHFRKDLRKAASDLKTALQKQTEAIRNSYQVSNDKQSPSPEVTVLNNLPSSIEVHHNEKDAKDERNYRRFTFLVTTLTLAVIAIYAALVFGQYQQMIKATVAAQQAVDEARLNRLQADKAFKATVEQFHLDQRAWVSVALSMPPTIQNIGKTPALNVTYWAFYHPAKGGLKDVAAWMKRQKEITPSVMSLGVLFPGQTYKSSPEENFGSPNTNASIKDGTVTLYYLMEGHYTSFGQRYTTRFCGVWLPKLAGFDPGHECSTWNYAD